MSDFLVAILKNFLNPSLLAFVLGVVAHFMTPRFKIPSSITTFLTCYLLVAIGLKGGVSIADHQVNSSLLIQATVLLSLWGVIEPLMIYFFLKRKKKLTHETIAAIAASFGSISMMTFVAAAYYLENFQITYESFLIVILAFMEVPAIVVGIFLGKVEQESNWSSLLETLKHSIFNKAVMSLVIGGILGFILGKWGNAVWCETIHAPFHWVLCLFLFDMGLSLGRQHHQLKSMNWNLGLFGIYVPVFGAIVGLLISWMLGLDVGSGTLVAVLCASASFLAVPAAMRLALPQAEESIYLSLSLGIAFPFNVTVGTPLYFKLAKLLLS